MFKIVGKRVLADNIYLMDIEAKRVSKSAKPGQFVIIKNDEKGDSSFFRIIICNC